MNKKQLRAAVIGVGYLGRFHAQKYFSINGVELVAVVDCNPERAQNVAVECCCAAFTDYREVVDKVDLVSIVVPTSLHHEVAGFFLDNGVDVLLEKPMTVTLKEADDLLIRAKAKKCILQIGHLERFNPAFKAVRPLLTTPAIVETTRVATFKNRGTDVSVVLDLMIHDIDLVLSIISGEVQEVTATGASLATPTIDVAHARLTFQSGAAAHLTVSRMAPETVRQIRIIQPQEIIDIDFNHRTLASSRCVGQGADAPIIKETKESFASADALLSEVAAFVNHVRQRSRPEVSGEEGRKALALALEVVDTIQKDQQNELFQNFFPAA